MDLSDVAFKLGFSQFKHHVRKAAELRRLCDVHFDSSVIGVGEVCKAVICLEIAAERYLLDDGPKVRWKNRKVMEKRGYEGWKSTVLASDDSKKLKAASCTRTKQTRLEFGRKVLLEDYYQKEICHKGCF